MTDNDTITAPTAQHRSMGFPGLSALHRDILIILASVGDCGDPRNGAHFEEVTEELRKWYDGNRISPGSVEDELLSMDDRYDYIECAGTGAFRVTVDGREWIEGYLHRVGQYWEDTNAWVDGSKLTIERQQVAEDHSDALNSFFKDGGDQNQGDR